MGVDDTIGEEQVRRLRAQLPTFTSTRDTAAQAVMRAAEDIDLDLSAVHGRSLATAVVDRIEKGLIAQGADWAYGIIARETDATRQQLVAPAKARAAADPDYLGVLRMHEQYVEGMIAARRWLRSCLINLAHHAPGQDTPDVAARDAATPAVPGGGAQNQRGRTIQVGAA